jgi:hypothetical protein
MMPSGHGSERMPELERVMQLAYDHGYRVGLQIGEHGRVVVHVRDVSHDAKVIAILGEDVETCAAELFVEMLRRAYVPRRDLETMGG